jgi:hypothetical protein
VARVPPHKKHNASLDLFDADKQSGFIVRFKSDVSMQSKQIDFTDFWMLLTKI